MIKRRMLFIVLCVVVSVVWIMAYLGLLNQTIGTLAVVNAIGYVAVIYAFRASFREIDTPTWWFAMGFAILAGAIIMRGLYWDFTLPLMRYFTPETAARWVEAVNGRIINVTFSLMKMAAFFCALKCREKMIPEEEQHLWPWYRAWAHHSNISLMPWRW